MKTIYTIHFNGAGLNSSSNGPVSTHANKRKAIAEAKHQASINAGAVDFQGGFFEVLREDGGVVDHFVFQSKVVR